MKGVTEKAKPFPVRVEHLNTDVFYGMDFKRIGPGLVISRDSTGSPICHFEDYEWSFPAYKLQLKDKCDFSFSYLKRDTSVDLTSTFFCKKIFLMRMFFPGSKSGQPIRLPSMHVMGLLLRKLFDFSEQHSVSVQAVFSESSNFETFADTLPVSLFKEVKLLIRTMNRLSISDLGFSVSGMVLLSIKKRFAEAFKEADQHPVIPSRILWTKYVQYNTCLADFDKHSHQLVEFIQKVSRNPYYARRYKPDGSSSDPDFSEKSTLDNQDSYTDFLPAIDDFGLQELQKKYKWRHVGNVSSFLSLVQYCCKSLIHIYTLMRHHEALELCTDCLESVRGWNNDALYVASISTKLTSTAAPNKWITIDAIVKPIEILTVINSLLSPFVKNEDNRDRLFISVSVLPFSNGVDPQDGKLVSGANCESKLSPVLITEDDIFELEAIDPFRNWRADKKFQIGKPWRITSHQFRRSIAVFAGQSGLITLPSLKRLLNHLTKVMATYYMKGCSANNYIFGLLNPVLTLEMKRAKGDADTAMYIRDVIRSERELYGFHGSRVMQDRVNSPWLYDSPEATAKQVRLGLLAYEETPFGGCASTTPCNKRAHGNFIDCPGCPKSVLDPDKIEETIKLVEWDLAELQPGTIEYKAELRNLEDYKNVQKLVLSKAGK